MGISRIDVLNQKKWGVTTPIFITIMGKKEKYFRKEKKLIKISGKDILSCILVGQNKILTPEILQEKKYKKIFSESEFWEQKEFFKEIIYQHNSGFYIYFSKTDNSEISYRIKLFFTDESYNDVMMFLNFINNK